MSRAGRSTLLVCAVLALLGRPAAAQEAVEYYATDALGSVRVVYAANGSLKGRMDFGPYGEQLTTAEGIGTKVFAQVTFDGESAMAYAEARMFHSRTGRFNAPDPLYAGAEDPQSWNRYTYAQNNPLSFVDPRGLQKRDPSLCTAEIKEINPNDFHCQTEDGEDSGGSGGGSVADFLLWLMDSAVGVESVWSAEQDWTATTGSTSWEPPTSVQVLVAAAVIITPAAARMVSKSAGRAVGAKVVTALEERAAQIHGALDPIAASRRTTAVLETTAGKIVGSGGRDLTPAQQGMLMADEIAARLPDAHAEITVITRAQEMGQLPVQLGVTRAICPACAATIESIGGALTLHCQVDSRFATAA